MTDPQQHQPNKFSFIVVLSLSPSRLHNPLGMKPKMKNHFRAHQLSIWLRLIPEIHKLGAGMEDVLARHNLFKNHDDMSLYDGHVRPDLFTRFPVFDENYKRRNNITSEFNGVYDGNVARPAFPGQIIKRCELIFITLDSR